MQVIADKELGMIGHASFTEFNASKMHFIFLQCLNGCINDYAYCILCLYIIVE